MPIHWPEGFGTIKMLGASLAFMSCGTAALAQGLSGPSSVGAELEPGDGLTDPQYRSDFPRNIAPNWFAWKDRLAENGFRFNIDYLALGQTTNADLGEAEAAGGIARFYGNWQASDLGSLTFKIEDRRSYTDVAPQFLGLDGGRCRSPAPHSTIAGFC
ncbi:hypothetical protein [Ruegeria sp. HKCCA5426]|uniref:hypothetical protein n=1 Tax=Ruegeria sp. HKCCA5426 TaxID=2682985 RepID=UPI0020C59B51|nr:hypothetical protein [Ruegeria sp. HKCCA5426]